MSIKKGGPILKFNLAMLLIIPMLASALAGQEVLLRRGDRLALVVPDRQELGRRLTIDERGEVHIPVIGDIHLEGMAVEEAEVTVLRRIREAYPSIRSITLSLIGEEARRIIYVQGLVVNPGKYDLEGMSNLWEAIREAGGTLAEASLEAVRLVRAEGDEQRTLITNVQEAIDSGDFESLPALKPGDTIIVPERSVPYRGSGAINILGAVISPAPYTLTGNRTLVDAILAAGGPTVNANLNKVKIIRPLPEGTILTIQVDFKRYLDEGDPRHNPVILPGDTVNVPQQSSYFRTLITDPRYFVSLMTATGTLAYIIIALR